jgi:hypothetical protein
MKLETKTTNFESIYHRFESIYHRATKAGEPHFGYYVLHEVDVWNYIVINGVEHYALYQTATECLGNDYDRPDPTIELSQAGGASDLLCLIDRITECEFEHDDDFKYTSLDELKELCADINNKDDVFQIWQLLRDNKINANQEFESIKPSDHLEDFEYFEETGELLIKN